MFIIKEALAAAEIAGDIDVIANGDDATVFFDALDADPQNPCPDLIILDLNLPARNGQEVLEHLRCIERCKDTPVIVVTSSNSPRDRRIARALGATDYFCKSSDYVEFLKLGLLVKSFLKEV